MANRRDNPAKVFVPFVDNNGQTVGGRYMNEQQFKQWLGGVPTDQKDEMWQSRVEQERASSDFQRRARDAAGPQSRLEGAGGAQYAGGPLNPYGGPVDRHGNPLTTQPRRVYAADPVTRQIRLMTREQYFRAYPNAPPEEWQQMMDYPNQPPTRVPSVAPNGDIRGVIPTSRLDGVGGAQYAGGPPSPAPTDRPSGGLEDFQPQRRDRSAIEDASIGDPSGASYGASGFLAPRDPTESTLPTYSGPATSPSGFGGNAGMYPAPIPANPFLQYPASYYRGDMGPGAAMPGALPPSIEQLQRQIGASGPQYAGSGGPPSDAAQQVAAYAGPPPANDNPGLKFGGVLRIPLPFVDQFGMQGGTYIINRSKMNDNSGGKWNRPNVLPFGPLSGLDYGIPGNVEANGPQLAFDPSGGGSNVQVFGGRTNIKPEITPPMGVDMIGKVLKDLQIQRDFKGGNWKLYGVQQGAAAEPKSLKGLPRYAGPGVPQTATGAFLPGQTTPAEILAARLQAEAAAAGGPPSPNVFGTDLRRLEARGAAAGRANNAADFIARVKAGIASGRYEPGGPPDITGTGSAVATLGRPVAAREHSVILDAIRPTAGDWTTAFRQELDPQTFLPLRGIVPGQDSSAAIWQRQRLADAVQRRADAVTGVGSGRPAPQIGPNTPSGPGPLTPADFVAAAQAAGRGIGNAASGAVDAVGALARSYWNDPMGNNPPPTTDENGVPLTPPSFTLPGEEASIGGPAMGYGPSPPAYSGGPPATPVPFTPTPAAPQVASAETIDRSGGGFSPSAFPPSWSAAPGGPRPVVTSSVTGSPGDDAVTAATRGAGDYGGYDPLSSAYVPFAPAGPANTPGAVAAGDMPATGRVDASGLSVDDAGYPDTGVSQPARVAARGAIGAVKYVKPQTVGQRVGGAAVRIAGNAMAPGVGTLLGMIYNSAMRHGGSFDNAQQYTGGPVTSYNRTGTTPWGSALYTTPSGSQSASMFTPFGSGWHAPNYSSVSGGALYAYNPETHTYVDSQGRVHSYD